MNESQTPLYGNLGIVISKTMVKKMEKTYPKKNAPIEILYFPHV